MFLLLTLSKKTSDETTFSYGQLSARTRIQAPSLAILIALASRRKSLVISFESITAL
jgi:hypothetical protein